MKEGISITEEEVHRVVEASGGDFRQMLNQLQLFILLRQQSKNKSGAYQNFQKDPTLGISPFDAIRSLLTENIQYNTAYDLFFTDYEMVPLLLQQNYLDSFKNGSHCNSLSDLAEAADSLCDLEYVHHTIVKNNVLFYVVLSS